MNEDQKMELASRLRKIRKSKYYTINDVAERTGLTASFISQLERGLTSASVATLQRIASELGISLSVLFEGIHSEEEQQIETVVTRYHEQKKLDYGFAIDYVLTDIDATMEVVYNEVEVGGGLTEPYRHESVKKIIFVITGTLEIVIDGEKYILNAKDSITFSGEKPHAWRNVGKETLKLVWILM